jgi:hypothetical protein
MLRAVMHRVLCVAVAMAVVAPLAAQAPTGWKVRLDRSTNAQDPDNTPNLKVATVGKGFRVTGGPAGTFWNPANTGTGAFTARANFTLKQPSNHTNYYGLIVGGADLDGAAQTYIYFLIAQDGTYIVRQRTGEAVQNVKASTPHASVRKPNEAGTSNNTLEIRVSGETVSYVINNVVVHTTPKTGATAKTDGIVGVRVNHVLDVEVDGFVVAKP